MLSFLQRLLGNNNAKEIKKMRAIADHINEIEPNYVKLSDANLVAKTDEFKRRLQKGETLDDILPEAFAVVREASKRVLGMRHFDVQLIGGICLHRGNIAEMRTGEGKTLVATLPVYLNSLTGNGVHVVTVNDYLATRDSEQMGRLYNFLGLSTGLIVANLDFNQRKEAYACDITYGTNNEFGFDYLRDNMVSDVSQMVQRPLNYAIVDEVDSILIDEARTPLIISGPGQRSTDNYYKLAKIVPHLVKDEDYTIDEKQKTIAPTDSGIAKVEKMLGVENLYDSENIELNHLLGASLRAYAMMHRDTDYVVKDGEVVIVDEFTGRLMFGRRYSDGLHQAIEAKEGLKVERESQTLASVTFQNYFRMYKKLAGMTGTAKTEEKEFIDIYGLEVLPIPPNKPLARIDLPDQIFKTKAAKYRAVVRNAVERHQTGQPILIGTTSITQSEELSDMLLRAGVPHKVLNAKHHEKEAEIVADAGQMGMVTIATNMAGRGTDITLGEGVPELGGLAILGTERHESRRIDNQLRGRAGRQGDPGSSVFYVSLEDKLMRLFGSERIAKVMDRLGFEDGERIESSMISNSIERAQKKVEENNFGIRKRLLEYDDVMNKQRTVIYEKRRHALMGERIGMDISNIIWDRCVSIIERNDYEGCKEEFLKVLAMECPFTEEELAAGHTEELAERSFQAAMDAFTRKTERIQTVAWPIIKEVYENQGAMYERIMVPITDGQRVYNIPCDLKEAYESEAKSVVKQFEKVILLHIIDDDWKENLRQLDDLRHSVQNASYEQKDPLLIFKLESVKLWDNMIDDMNNRTASVLMRGQIPEMQPAEDIQEAAPEQHGQQYKEEKVELNDPNQVAAAQHDTREGAQEVNHTPYRADKMPRPNDPCPCGSGKKFKNCHGRDIR